MVDIEHNRSMIGRSLEAKMNRLRNLRHVDDRARKSVIRANRGINFKAGHPLSYLLVQDGRVELGSRAPAYFKLLNLNGDRLAEIYSAWVVEGSMRG